MSDVAAAIADDSVVASIVAEHDGNIVASVVANVGIIVADVIVGIAGVVTIRVAEVMLTLCIP